MIALVAGAPVDQYEVGVADFGGGSGPAVWQCGSGADANDRRKGAAGAAAEADGIFEFIGKAFFALLRRNLAAEVPKRLFGDFYCFANRLDLVGILDLA